MNENEFQTEGTQNTEGTQMSEKIDIELLRMWKFRDLFTFKINLDEIVFDLFIALYLMFLPLDKIIHGMEGNNSILLVVLKILIVTVIAYLFSTFLNDLTIMIYAIHNSLSKRKNELLLNVDEKGRISTNSRVLNTTKIIFAMVFLFLSIMLPVLGTSTFSSGYPSLDSEDYLGQILFFVVEGYALVLFIFSLIFENFYDTLMSTLQIMGGVTIFFISIYLLLVSIYKLIAFIAFIFVFLFLIAYLGDKLVNFVKKIYKNLKNKMGEKTLKTVGILIRSIFIATLLSLYTMIIYRFFGKDLNILALFFSGIIPVRIMLLFKLPINPINFIIGMLVILGILAW
jgi:hypothetical protein